MGPTLNLTDRLGSTPKIQNHKAPTPSATHSAINFRDQIIVHQKWKTRFQVAIKEGSVGDLSNHNVSRDDQCELGRWIHGVGQQRFSDDPLFQKLRMDHDYFHAYTGTILELIQMGDKAAETLLRSSEYLHISQDVCLDLAQMHIQAR